MYGINIKELRAIDRKARRWPAKRHHCQFHTRAHHSVTLRLQKRRATKDAGSAQGVHSFILCVAGLSVTSTTHIECCR